MGEAQLIDPKSGADAARIQLVGHDPLANLLDGGAIGDVGDLLDLTPITVRQRCPVDRLIHPST
jgi:hypothetical protein